MFKKIYLNKELVLFTIAKYHFFVFYSMSSKNIVSAADGCNITGCPTIQGIPPLSCCGNGSCTNDPATCGTSGSTGGDSPTCGDSKQCRACASYTKSGSGCGFVGTPGLGLRVCVAQLSCYQDQCRGWDSIGQQACSNYGASVDKKNIAPYYR